MTLTCKLPTLNKELIIIISHICCYLDKESYKRFSVWRLILFRGAKLSPAATFSA